MEMTLLFANKGKIKSGENSSNSYREMVPKDAPNTKKRMKLPIFKDQFLGK